MELEIIGYSVPRHRKFAASSNEIGFPRALRLYSRGETSSRPHTSKYVPWLESRSRFIPIMYYFTWVHFARKDPKVFCEPCNRKQTPNNWLKLFIHLLLVSDCLFFQAINVRAMVDFIKLCITGNTDGENVDHCTDLIVLTRCFCLSMLQVSGQLLDTEFQPTVTATCKGGYMTIRVNLNQSFVGVVHVREYRKSPCMVPGNGSNHATLGINLLASPDAPDYCGVHVNNVSRRKMKPKENAI